MKVISSKERAIWFRVCATSSLVVDFMLASICVVTNRSSVLDSLLISPFNWLISPLVLRARSIEFCRCGWASFSTLSSLWLICLRYAPQWFEYFSNNSYTENESRAEQFFVDRKPLRRLIKCEPRKNVSTSLEGIKVSNQSSPPGANRRFTFDR